MKLKSILSILIGLLGLTFVVLIHEFGHFAFCKIFGVRTPIFSIGFDPAIISYLIGSTKFQLGALPLGGYVSINEYDLNLLNYIPKMMIILAGIAFNIIFSVAVFYYLYRKNVANRKELLEYEVENRSKLGTFLALSKPEKLEEAVPKSYRNGLIGPIGIVSLIGRSFYVGFDVFMYFLAVISINVAIFNLLPIPFFDGGQAFLITMESVFGSEVSSYVWEILKYIFFTLLLVFTIYILIKDLFRLRK